MKLSKQPALVGSSSPGQTHHPGSDRRVRTNPTSFGLETSLPASRSHPRSRLVSRGPCRLGSDAIAGGRWAWRRRSSTPRSSECIMPSLSGSTRAVVDVGASRVSIPPVRSPKAWRVAISPAGHRQSSSSTAERSIRCRIDASGGVPPSISRCLPRPTLTDTKSAWMLRFRHPSSRDSV